MRKPSDKYRESLAGLDAFDKITRGFVWKFEPKPSTPPTPKPVKDDTMKTITLTTLDARKLIEFLHHGYEQGGYTDPDDAIEYGYAHCLKGRCPDHDGDRRRDPDCAACKLLVLLEAKLAGDDKAKDDADPFDKILDGAW